MDLKLALKQPTFRWLPKHLNHIAENIAIKKRNISFLAINALFRLKDYNVLNVNRPFADSFIINGYVPLQPNDQLRKKAEKLSVIFRIDNHNNIIPITAYSESDEE
ncbi:hypothetical protein MHK_010661 [Candidatus Magnetomorum sp. HK-1]|nr:hypothetical protein MHK_010661 [Candidatus Magnetomorum sp. HK-1]